MATKVIPAKNGKHHSQKQGSPASTITVWKSLRSNFEKMDKVKQGISKHDLVEVKRYINMDYDRLSNILGTTKTTIHSKKMEDKFSLGVSEKIIALVDLYNFGYEVFGDKAGFEHWIQTTNQALGNKAPLELMDTIFGIDEVKNLIGRIEHGIYS